MTAAPTRLRRPDVPGNSAERSARSTRLLGWSFLVLICGAWSASMILGYRTALAIVTTFGFLGAALGIAQPTLGLLAIGVLCTVDAPARILLLTGGIWRWNTINYWLLFVLICFAPLVLRWRDVHTRLAQLVLAVLAVGLTISPNPAEGVQHILGMLSVLGLMVYFVRARLDGLLLYWLALVCGTTSALGSIAFLLQQHAVPYVNPNAFAFLPLTGVFAICLGFPGAATVRNGQLLLSVLAGINLACIFLTGSRGAMLSGIACALFLAMTLRGMGTRVIALFVAACVALGIATVFTDLQEHAVHRLDKLFTSEYSLAARTSGRSELVRAGLLVFQRQPLGVGTGGFAAQYPDVSEIPGFTGFGRGRQIPAHSAWIKVLAENGLPGVVLLAAYVLSFGIVGLRRGDRTLRALGLLGTCGLGVAFLSTEFQDKGLWLLASGITVVLTCRTVPAGRPSVS